MKRKRYGFGGDDGKSPKKVDAVPAGYVEDTDFIDKDNPNRKYYKMVTSGKQAATVPILPSNNNTTTLPVRKPTSKITTGTNVVKKPIATSNAAQDIDRVYIDPQTNTPTQQVLAQSNPTPSPAAAFRGDNIFMRANGSNRAIGQAVYPARKSANSGDAGVLNTANQNVQFQYYKPNSGDVDGTTINIPVDDWNKRGNTSNFADTSFINKYKPKMGTGGDVDAATTSGNRSSMMGDITAIAPSLFNGITSLLNANNNIPSRQPLVNINSMRNMVNPYYAFGGDTSDISDDDIQMLQDEADKRGMTIEDLIDEMNGNNQDDSQSDDDSDEDTPQEDTDDDGYAMGGIHINPKNKGKFNALKQRTGKSTEELTHSSNPLTKKRAIFAQNASRWQHAMGGNAGDKPINVEGNEVVQEPGKAPVKMVGPSHEQGGIDMNVKDGTKIFSDRLKIDGKSMQERKVGRIKRMDNLNKLLLKNPDNNLLKNSILRTKAVSNSEEQKDMALQNVANKIYTVPSPSDGNDTPMHPFGGRVGYAYGGDDDDGIETTYDPNYDPIRTIPQYNIPDIPTGAVNSDIMKTPTIGTIPPINNSNNTNAPIPSRSRFTTGDMIGTAGSVFGAVAPLLNTLGNKKNTQPVINRYQGIGHDAIEANDMAQRYEARTRDESINDINTSANSAIARNRSSASSVNTQRALDAVTQIGKGKAIEGENSNFSKGMVSLLDERGKLTNFRDQYQDFGQTKADEANASNLDNFYTNKGANLANIGSSIQTIGRNFNTSQKNEDDEDLLGLLSPYGLSIKRGANGRFQLSN